MTAVRWLLRGLGAGGLMLLSVLVGVSGSFVQAMDSYVAGVWVPWGVALAIAATAGLVTLARAVTSSRWMVALVVVGWLVGVIPFTFQRPEGDLVIQSGATGLVFLVAGVVVAGVGLGLSAPSTNSVGSGAESDSIELPLGR